MVYIQGRLGYLSQKSDLSNRIFVGIKYALAFVSLGLPHGQLPSSPTPLNNQQNFTGIHFEISYYLVRILSSAFGPHPVFLTVQDRHE